ncbi:MULTISPECIES: M60 family metallopeptidase [unclassified Carboxylicivirga]|uniref:M60 family metallopeptidase n=1 Tax=Carboxylicivirga TaxID=1628153 RepID=UPI003D32B7A2
MKSIILILLSVLLTCALPACSDDGESPGVTTLEIAEGNTQLGFQVHASTKDVSVKTNAEAINITSQYEWCQAIFNADRGVLTINVEENPSLESRECTIKLSAGSSEATITVMQFGVKPQIFLPSRLVEIDFKEQVLELDVMSNVEVVAVCDAVPWVQNAADLKSVSIDPVSYSFRLQVAAVDSEAGRSGWIYFHHTEGTYKDSMQIKQALVASEDYQPESTDSFEKDKKLTIASASLSPADKFQSGQGIELSIDGDHNTLYHSPWSGMPADTDITLEYTFDANAEILNYLVLQPRKSGSNGIIKTASVWVTTEANSAYQQVATIDAPDSNNPFVVRFDAPVVAPRSLKIIVTDAYAHDVGKYYVSLAELECYESKSLNALAEDQQFFTDETFSVLHPGFTVQDLSRIQNPFLQNIAAYLLAGCYDATYRVQNYEAYRPVADLARELKTSSYSQFENPTGMYFKTGDEVIIFMADPNGQDLNLRVRDWGPSGDDHSYRLSKGLNVITMKGQGNGYVSYYTPDYKTAQDVKIHIASGQVNGYFDVTKHSNEDGTSLLENAVSEIMDIRGKKVQLAYSVDALRTNCYENLYDLTLVYDSIVSSQHTIMGLEKYKRTPKNRMFGRVIWNGFMHADGIGAAFNINTLKSIANYERLKNTIWGPAHEFGHVNQVRPGMKWVGTTECTNNIYSAWIQFCYTPNNLRLEHENVGGSIGGRFNAYLNNAFVNNQEWGLQGGPDSGYGPGNDGTWGGDHFVKLCPLWQLQLYFHVAGEGNEWYRPYFYGDVFEAVRNTDEQGFTHGEMQVNFIKNMCDAVQYDLTDFFKRIGMLQPVDKFFGDYSNAQKTITQSMVDEVVSYAAQYPKLDYDYIHYISGNSYKAYKHKMAVVGQYNAGLVGGIVKQINHSVWQNVTVFETYANDVLTHITMVGTGSADNTSTKVPYPESSTRIEAVAFDGTRTLVCGQR